MRTVVDVESFNRTTLPWGGERLPDDSREYNWHDASEFVEVISPADSTYRSRSDNFSSCERRTMTKVIDAESFNHTTCTCGSGRLEDERREYLRHDTDEFVGVESSSLTVASGRTSSFCSYDGCILRQCMDNKTSAGESSGEERPPDKSWASTWHNTVAFTNVISPASVAMSTRDEAFGSPSRPMTKKFVVDGTNTKTACGRKELPDGRYTFKLHNAGEFDKDASPFELVASIYSNPVREQRVQHPEHFIKAKTIRGGGRCPAQRYLSPRGNVVTFTTSEDYCGSETVHHNVSTVKVENQTTSRVAPESNALNSNASDNAKYNYVAVDKEERVCGVTTNSAQSTEQANMSFSTAVKMVDHSAKMKGVHCDPFRRSLRTFEVASERAAEVAAEVAAEHLSLAEFGATSFGAAGRCNCAIGAPGDRGCNLYSKVESLSERLNVKSTENITCTPFGSADVTQEDPTTGDLANTTGVYQELRRDSYRTIEVMRALNPYHHTKQQISARKKLTKRSILPPPAELENNREDARGRKVFDRGKELEVGRRGDRRKMAGRKVRATMSIVVSGVPGSGLELETLCKSSFGDKNGVNTSMNFVSIKLSILLTHRASI
eukprot:CAMPEP_0118643122 /NCGR_PEP_ID=MMETSP0785-20121206/6225_1 /TAXON_ID=91992 /ORGANISM="Bolidomonas pacifica, Strain CCMP 1866" /LENGTH=606 /DNA_ID=CAMNT_0006534769 /DNA_START=551 /DNA_END=2369 /DNA_ORIENTATION=+